MLLAGSDDGIYRVGDDGGSTKRLDSGRVMRLTRSTAVDGVFAATTTGLYRSRDGGESWTDLSVPTQQVYAVGASPDGRLYAGTRPARIYVTDSTHSPEWRELEGLQDLPSREEWRLPRHENLAQVRDVHAVTEDHVVAGVEVGGIHVSEDGGETWTERRNGVNDDIHELHAVTADEYVAATGFGLFRTVDAGRTWTRLDDCVDQRYFRCVVSVDDTVYAGGALASSASWTDDDADPGLFAFRDSELLELDVPFPDETATGMTTEDGDLVVTTHRGNVFARRGPDWERVGSVPTSGELTGRYTPLLAIDA